MRVLGCERSVSKGWGRELEDHDMCRGMCKPLAARLGLEPLTETDGRCREARRLRDISHMLSIPRISSLPRLNLRFLFFLFFLCFFFFLLLFKLGARR